MNEYDIIESYFKTLVEKYGTEEKERQAGLRYCDGSKQMYYEKCIRLGK